MRVMNNRRRLIPATAFAAATALAMPALAACSADATAASDAKNSGKLKVTTSFYPLEFLVGQIGGDHVAITDLTKPGVEPHDLELAPKQVAGLTESDVIVYLKGLQPAVHAAIKEP